MDLTLDINAVYGGFSLAVNDSYSLQGVTALFGPSGAGKTTLLRIIAGLERGGLVEWNGDNWESDRGFVPAWRRPVGIVFQDARLFGHLSVRGNLEFASSCARGEASAGSDRILELTGVKPLLERRAATLSGGEQKRVAIARSLLAAPELLLMDEPLAGLDRVSGQTILALLRSLADGIGLPIVYVSHEIGEIVEIADRVIALNAGRVVASGSAIETLAALGPEFTGSFEAGAVLLGAVDGYDAGHQMLRVRIGQTLLWLPADESQAIPADDSDVRMRLRARDVSIARAQLYDVSIRNQLPVTIDAIGSAEGPHADVRLVTDDGQALLARLTRLAIDEMCLAPGDRVFALIKSVAFDRGPA